MEHRRPLRARTARPTSFAQDDIETLFSTAYEVHFNSARTGVRLIGPTPKWARTDGGEAGLHPSNIHDNAYAVGAIDFTGDMPIILGPDGPSLGGFVCPAVIARDELWKIGQFKPGDTYPLSCRRAKRRSCRRSCRSSARAGYRLGHRRRHATMARSRSSTAARATTTCLVEYGPMALDIALRLRVHLLMQAVMEARPARSHRSDARHPLAADPL